MPLRSRAFRQWFFANCASEFETVPSAHAFNAILYHLEAQAAREPDRCNIRVPYRIDSRGLSSTPEKILLDLANSDSEFVEITPAGWTVTSGDGVPFETSFSTQSLPHPEPAGEPDPAADPPVDSPLDTLRSTLNLGAPNSLEWLRCLAWLLAALRPGGPYPILILRGPSGCGKSFAARILRTLIDPSSSPFTPLPSSARELLALARINWVLAFDHVSTLNPQTVDALCRLTAGVGVAGREPGQREPLQLYIKRPILLTVTDSWTPPPDLAARALTVTLQPLTDARRRPEHELGKVIEQAFPRILGALCTAVSQALACPAQPASSPTRHAAALAWALGAAPALNCAPLEMLQAFDAPPPSDPFVVAVRRLLDRTPQWSGAAAELLQLLPLCQTPRALSARLNKSILPLADAGIRVQFRRLPGGARRIDLFASQNPPPPPQPKPKKDLIPPPNIPPDLGICVTTPPSSLPSAPSARRPDKAPALLLVCTLFFSPETLWDRRSFFVVCQPLVSTGSGFPIPFHYDVVVALAPRFLCALSVSALKRISHAAITLPHIPICTPPDNHPSAHRHFCGKLVCTSSEATSMPTTTKLLFAAAFTAILSAQTAEELVDRNLQAKGGVEKIKAIRTLRATGKLQQGGFTVQVATDSMAPNLLRQNFTIQGMTQIQAYDGNVGWKISPFEGRKDPQLMGEEELREIVEDADFYGPLVDYRAKGNKIEYIGKDTVDGDDVHRLKVTLKNGDIYYYYLDPETFLEIRTEKVQFIRGAVRESVIECGSYKLVAGVYMPFTYEVGSKQNPESRSKITYDRIEPGVTLDPAEFKLPAAGGKEF